MRLYPYVLFLVAAVMPGCTHFHTNMLAESIKTFSGKMQAAPTDKIWVTSNSDSSCDSGCQSPLTCGGGGGAGKKLGGLFGGFGGPSSSDKLAYQVISNYLTQGKKARVIETHRHTWQSCLRHLGGCRAERDCGRSRSVATACGPADQQCAAVDVRWPAGGRGVFLGGWFVDDLPERA